MHDGPHPAERPEAVMEALKEAIREDPSLRRLPPESLADELVGRDYLKHRPDPSVVVFLLNLIGPARGRG